MTKLKLAILGVGLIGGSFGLAVKDKLKDSVYITGTTHTEASSKMAQKIGAVDECGVDNVKAVQNADVIYLSTPVLQMIPIVSQILPYLQKGTIITDAGSTKQYIANQLSQILPKNIYYVAAHPMAGREKSGVIAATKDLFKDKCYVLIKDKKITAPMDAVKKIRGLIALTDANIVELSLSEHDACAALISHIPHITAAALVTLLTHNTDCIEACVKLAGGGFKDTTRVASSNADMWADICLSNSKAIADNLRQLQKILENTALAIEAKDREKLHKYFTTARKTRNYILKQTEDIYKVE